MSGGIAYVYDPEGDFHKKCNQEMVTLEKLEDPEEINAVEQMLRRHIKHTGSRLAESILVRWNAMVPKFVKVLPIDYKRMMEAFKQVELSGLSGDEAVMAAFELNKNDLARVSGN